MTDEDIEDELQNLDIKDSDEGSGSDITPTNASPRQISQLCFPLNFYRSGLDEEFKRRNILGQRNSNYEDYELRSTSSLSWGEDEFEGEATRIVNKLFEQVDQIMYDEEIKPKCLYIPQTKYLEQKLELATRKEIKDMPKGPPSFIATQNQFLPEGDDDIGSLDTSVPKLSPSLLAECEQWVANFPHFRVTGTGVAMRRLAQLEALAFDNLSENDIPEEEEELILQDGDYEGKLQNVALQCDTLSRKDKDSLGPPSRICSGSNDPEVLREQILISLFDLLWVTIAETIEPLVNQFTGFLRNQSQPHRVLSPPLTSIPPINRPLSAIGLNKRLINVPTNKLSDVFGSILQVSSKPLQNPDNRETLRSLSASRIRNLPDSFQASPVSFPSLDYRPVSSRSPNSLMIPRLNSDHRPLSNSSLMRLRFSDKYASLRAGAIDEGRAYTEQRPKSSALLPPINDRVSTPKERAKAKVLIEPSEGMLSVRGRAVSARSLTFANLPISTTTESAMSLTEVEGFVSWIVSQVEEHHTAHHIAYLLDKSKHLRRNARSATSSDQNGTTATKRHHCHLTILPPKPEDITLTQTVYAAQSIQFNTQYTLPSYIPPSKTTGIQTSYP